MMRFTTLLNPRLVKSALMQFDTKKQAVFSNKPAGAASAPSVKPFNPFHNAEAILNKLPRQETPKQPQPIEKKPDPISELDIDVLESEGPFHSSKAVLSDSKNPFDVFSKQAVSSAKKEAELSKSYLPQKEAVYKNKTEIKSQPKNDIITKEPPQPTLFEPQKDSLKYIGEAFDTYIIVENNKKELLFIDKHAAHERIIYEKLKADKTGSAAQLLLQPVTVTLGKEEYNAAVNNLEMFRECSFDVEDFGNSTVIVRSAPQYIDAAEIADCITEMADYISQGKNDIFTEKMDWFYHNVACRSAIKAGNKNSAQELMDIVKTLEENPDIRYCPHGRPITIIMKKSEIERQFGRV